MLEHTPNSAQAATNFNNGDRLDLHVRSEHVMPYENKDAAALAALATAETVTPTPERRELRKHDQIGIVGKYVTALRRAEIEQYDFTPQPSDKPLDFELTA